MRVLIDLRPALDGFSGIPQETRLLFRGLAGMDGISVSGLLQSGNLALEAGLPPGADARSQAHAVDRSSLVVVSLQQGPSSTRAEHWRRRWLRFAGPVGAAVLGAVGGSTPLTRFDATHFRDFVWRALFAKSLPVEDIDVVTRSEFRVMRWPWSVANAFGVVTAKLGRAMYPRLDTREFDVMLAETPYPGRVSPRTRLVVRYHDAIPLLMPHTIKDRGYHRAMHLQALKRNAADGAWFACVSEATRRDLLSVMPEIEERTIVIPNMISHPFRLEIEPADRVAEIIWSRKNRHAPHDGGAPLAGGESAPRYLLMVSTIEPRKNHVALLDAWEMLRADDPGLQLVCVGSLGWEHESTMRRLEPWLRRGGVHLLEGVPADDLRLLYRHAAATVCPSLGEGFDFAGVEAMASGGVVAASEIPVHREVYADAADYFSAYDTRAMAAVIGALIGPGGGARRADLQARGQRVSARYRSEAVLPRWAEFMGRLGGGAKVGL